jgi:2-dehydropantoate 2-reductase
VRVCTRSAEDAAAIAANGVAVEEPENGGAWTARVAAQAGPPVAERGWILVCVREPQSVAAADALADASPDARVVNVQNGLGGDAVFARRFAVVTGAVIRHGCTRVAADRVRCMTSARIVLGRHPEGADASLEAIATLLRDANYEVGLSARIADDRWLKLCINLMSTPNALVRPSEHATAAFTHGKARLLEEARDALAAAGIAARSCDGRDRSLDAEIAHQRAALARGTAARALPIYNSFWQALRRGAPIEADSMHEAVIGLGRRHGIATPVNEAALAAVRRVVADRLGPESLTVGECLGGGP